MISGIKFLSQKEGLHGIYGSKFIHYDGNGTSSGKVGVKSASKTSNL